MTIHLDLDGVLANFDKAAGAAIGTDDIYKFDFVYGPKEFWRRINEVQEFFLTMEMMPDAEELMDFLGGERLSILTALPLSNPDRVQAQKRAWVRKHIGDVFVTCCATKDKPFFCSPGDILVDDRAINREAWISRGGKYVLHTSAADTIEQLKGLGVGASA